VIQIDVRPTVKTRPTHHTLSPHMVLDHTYLTRLTHSNHSRSRQQRWTKPLLLRKRAFDTIHSMSIDRSMGLYLVSLPWRQATRLTGLISPVCDRYVQYLLVGVNPSVLNRHRQGLQPPKGLAWSQVIQSQHSLKWNGVKHLSPTRGLSTTRHLSKSISTPSNG
jgi:hypothetical protein